MSNKKEVSVLHEYTYEYSDGTRHKFAVDDVIQVIREDNDWLSVVADGETTQFWIPRNYVQECTPLKRIASVKPTPSSSIPTSKTKPVAAGTSDSNTIATELGSRSSQSTVDTDFEPEYELTSEPEGNDPNHSPEHGYYNVNVRPSRAAEDRVQETLNNVCVTVLQLQKKLAEIEETYSDPRNYPPKPAETPVRNRTNTKDEEKDPHQYYDADEESHPAAADDVKCLYDDFTNPQPAQRGCIITSSTKRKKKLRENRQEAKFASKEMMHLGVFLDYRKIGRIYTLIIHIVLCRDTWQLRSINNTKLFESKPFLVYEDRGDPVIQVDSLQWEPNSAEHKEEPNVASLDILWQGLPCEFKFIRQFKSSLFSPAVPKIIKFDVSVVQDDTPKTTLNIFAEKNEVKAGNLRRSLEKKTKDLYCDPRPAGIYGDPRPAGIYGDPRPAGPQSPIYGIPESNASPMDDLTYIVPVPDPEMQQTPQNRSTVAAPFNGPTQQTSPHYTPLVRSNRPTPPIPSSPDTQTPHRDLSPLLVARPKSDNVKTVNYVNLPKTQN